MTPAKNGGESQSYSVASGGASAEVGGSACLPPAFPDLPAKSDFSDRRPPLVSFAYGHNPLKQGPPGRSEKGAIPLKTVHLEPSSLRIYPSGFIWKGETAKGIECPLPDSKRSEITTLTPQTANRIRSFLISNWGGEHYECYAASLTTHGNNSPEQWRSIIKRARTYFAREYPEWALLWRVELQKREAPHLHCVVWVPGPIPDWLFYRAMQKLWLKASRETEDRHARKYAVRTRLVPPEDAHGWYLYETLHTGKKKESQLGWKGKQWGLWNRDSWKPRPTTGDGEMTKREMVLFIRALRRWDYANRRASRKPEVRKNAKKHRYWLNHGGMTRVIPQNVTVPIIQWVASLP